MAKNDFPESYKDPLYASLDAATEQRLGLPAGLLSGIRLNGERSNASQVSGAGAASPYQIIPATREALIRKHGIDPLASPEAASQGAGLLLKESLDRNKGDAAAAIGEYIGGTNRANWGPQTKAYINRVSVGLKKAESDQADTLGKSFDDWLAKNPAVPATPAVPTQTAPSQAGKPSDALLQGFDAWVASEGGPKAGMAAPAPVQQPEKPGVVSTMLGLGPGQESSMPPIMQAAGALGASALLTPVAGLAGLGTAAGNALGLTDKNPVDVINNITGLAGNLVTTPEGERALETAATPFQKLAEVADVAGQKVSDVTGSPALGTAANTALQMAVPAVVGKGIGATVAKAIPAVTEAVAPTAIGRGVGAAATAVEQAARSATTLPRRALEMIQRKPEGQPTPGTLGSAGAAATDAAAQRIATAEGLGFTGDTGLTTGQATRDSAQLKFETETAKLPGEGKPLRDRTIAQNNHILSNFDTMIDQTGAKEPTLRAVGQSVDNALRGQYARDTTQVRAAYAEANRSPEASAIVDQASPVPIEMDGAMTTKTPLEYLNEQPRGLPNTGLADTARQMAVRTGVAIEQDGQLIPRQATIRQMEEWRKAINASTGYEPTDIRTSSILKALIDGQTEPVAGPLYRQARGLRTRFAQNYEDRAVINKLLTEKPGTSDRRVAFEDVLDHTMLKGSLDDVRNVRRVLQRSGPEGQQAWRELQGGTLGNIRDQAFKNVATDSSGNRIVSPAALEKAIKALDADGRLDFIFGKQGAQTLRDLNEIVKGVRTVPPEAAINMSNTASTLMTMLDYGASTMVGAPAPIVHGWMKARQYIKDRALRKRIDDALNRRSISRKP